MKELIKDSVVSKLKTTESEITRICQEQIQTQLQKPHETETEQRLKDMQQ